MSITLSKKKCIVKKIKKIANEAKSIIVTNYKGLSSPEITNLRSLARKNEVHLLIAKNNLLRIGFKDTVYDNFNLHLKGPTLLFFSGNELSSSAKIIKKFCETNNKLKVNVISLSGKLFHEKELNYISNLPTRQEAIFSFVFLLRVPMNNFIRTAKASNIKLIILLKELSKKLS